MNENTQTVCSTESNHRGNHEPGNCRYHLVNEAHCLCVLKQERPKARVEENSNELIPEEEEEEEEERVAN